MDPITLGIIAYKASSFAADAALTGASVAAGVAGAAGKKVIEIAVPVVKKTGTISLNFVRGGINGVKEGEQNSLKLAKQLDIIDNGLNIPLSFGDNQFKKINNDISSDLNIIKGQNEVLFLSNSIRYFLDSHAMKTGIDRGISFALQYDIKAVLNHLEKTPDLRFPGYLLHQCLSLSETIKEYNLFYDGILNDGAINEWTKESAFERLEKTFGIDGNQSSLRRYIPAEYHREWNKAKYLSESNSKDQAKWKKLFTSNEKEINDEAHGALFTLSDELVANEALEFDIYQKLESKPNSKLLIESYN